MVEKGERKQLRTTKKIVSTAVLTGLRAPGEHLG